MARRSIFNAPPSDEEQDEEEEEEEEHQPSDIIPSDTESEPEQQSLSDEEEQDEDEDGAELPEEEEDGEEDADQGQDGRHSPAASDSDSDTPQRWGTHTDTRRTVQPFYAVIASLDRAHNASLASHLYSAHLIKRHHNHHLLAPSSSSSSSSSSSRDTTDTDTREYPPTQLASADGLLPPRSKRFVTNAWTSWPHPPHHVPREHEHEPRGTLKSQPRSSHIDAATYNTTTTAPPTPAPSHMLEEALTAAFLRAGTEQLRGRGAEAETGLLPLLDADVGAHLLRPVVRSVIGRLDGLLHALYHERSHAKVLVEEEAAAEGRRRPSGYKKAQARRKKALPKARQRAVTPMTDTEEEQEQEQEQEQARQAKHAGDDSPPAPPLVPAGAAKSSPPSARRRKRAPALAQRWAKKRQTRLRLRDWSNVVGVAALTGGFEDAAVQRTARRCGAQFGQAVRWRRLAPDDHLCGRRAGDEWVGARLEEEAGGSAGETWGGICRDGFLQPVVRERRDVGRKRPAKGGEARGEAAAAGAGAGGDVMGGG